MTMATAYVLGASRSYPIMQLDLKENIQNATNGKVYVKLAPGGQLGAGGALAQAVQGGTIQARSIRCRTSRPSRARST
jgi:TRAP-type C4-dicarboxylate transport system substrate-binding protein